MKGMKLIVAAAALAISGAAFAGPQWSFVQGDLGLLESVDTDAKNSAYGLQGSFGFASIWHVGAALQSENIETIVNSSTGEVRKDKNDAYKLWVGVHPHINDSTDVFFDIGYGEIGLDNPAQICSPSDPPVCSNLSDPSFYEVTAGIRSMLTDKLELNAEFAWGDIDEFGADTNWSFGGQYLFTPAFSVGASYVNERPVVIGGSKGGISAVMLNVRWGFD